MFWCVLFETDLGNVSIGGYFHDIHCSRGFQIPGLG